jgi:hypothetical protein
MVMGKIKMWVGVSGQRVVHVMLVLGLGDCCPTCQRLRQDLMSMRNRLRVCSLDFAVCTLH